MKHSNELAKVAAALVAAQGEIKSITKDSTNPHFKNKYVSLDALTEAVRPILFKHGLSLIQGAVPTTEEGGRLTALTVETMLLHSSGEWISNGITLPVGTVSIKNKAGEVVGAEPTAQTAGGAVTYGRRYGLTALLAITTDEDDDGAKASARAPAKNGATAAAPPPKKAPADKVMPFGSNRGKKMGEIETADLESCVGWCRETDEAKFEDLIATITEVLRTRPALARADGEEIDDSDLPF